VQTNSLLRGAASPREAASDERRDARVEVDLDVARGQREGELVVFVA
jgi:hypothetical protein